MNTFAELLVNTLIILNTIFSITKFIASEVDSHNLQLNMSIIFSFTDISFNFLCLLNNLKHTHLPIDIEYSVNPIYNTTFNYLIIPSHLLENVAFNFICSV